MPRSVRQPEARRDVHAQLRHYKTTGRFHRPPIPTKVFLAYDPCSAALWHQSLAKRTAHDCYLSDPFDVLELDCGCYFEEVDGAGR